MPHSQPPAHTGQSHSVIKRGIEVSGKGGVSFKENTDGMEAGGKHGAGQENGESLNDLGPPRAGEADLRLDV